MSAWLLDGSAADDADVGAALALTGHFLARHWLHGDALEGLRRRAVGGRAAGSD